jgi:hypothetical protein
MEVGIEGCLHIEFEYNISQLQRQRKRINGRTCETKLKKTCSITAIHVSVTKATTGKWYSICYKNKLIRLQIWLLIPSGHCKERHLLTSSHQITLNHHLHLLPLLPHQHACNPVPNLQQTIKNMAPTTICSRKLIEVQKKGITIISKFQLHSLTQYK